MNIQQETKDIAFKALKDLKHKVEYGRDGSYLCNSCKLQWDWKTEAESHYILMCLETVFPIIWDACGKADSEENPNLSPSSSKLYQLEEHDEQVAVKAKIETLEEAAKLVIAETNRVWSPHQFDDVRQASEYTAELLRQHSAALQAKNITNISTSSPEQRTDHLNAVLASYWDNFPAETVGTATIPEDFMAGWNARDVEVKALKERITAVEDVLAKPYPANSYYLNGMPDQYAALTEFFSEEFSNALKAALFDLTGDKTQ